MTFLICQCECVLFTIIHIAVHVIGNQKISKHPFRILHKPPIFGGETVCQSRWSDPGCQTENMTKCNKMWQGARDLQMPSECDRGHEGLTRCVLLWRDAPGQDEKATFWLLAWCQRRWYSAHQKDPASCVAKMSEVCGWPTPSYATIALTRECKAWTG